MLKGVSPKTVTFDPKLLGISEVILTPTLFRRTFLSSFERTLCLQFARQEFNQIGNFFDQNGFSKFS